jgi:hypothetical protein
MLLHTTAHNRPSDKFSLSLYSDVVIQLIQMALALLFYSFTILISRYCNAHCNVFLS